MILGNLSILFVLLTLDGCKTVIHFRIQLAICSCTVRSFLIDVLLQSGVCINAVIGFLLDAFSIGFNILFIGSDAFFMVVKFIAIGFDGIRVVLNIASICLDVFLILGNLSILFVLLTLNDTYFRIHITLQFIISCLTVANFLLNSIFIGCNRRI